MKKILAVLLLAVLSCPGFAQDQTKKTDSVCRLLQQYFNEKNTAAVYELTGEAFKKSISAEVFQNISQNNLFPLGDLSQVIYEKKSAAGVYKYKAVFPTVTLALYLSLDEKDKLATFLFKEYVDESIRKTGPVATSNPLVTAMDKAVDQAVKPYMELPATAGICVGILKNGSMSFYGYGETTKGSQTIPDQKTLFEIGSITKTFTAILLADAVNEGLIHLDDPAQRYLPQAAALNQFPGTPVTIRMLSNHSSGLPRMPDNFPGSTDNANPYKNYDSTLLMDFIHQMKLQRKPGTSYEYSNLAVATLGIILEKIRKKSFEQMVMEKITGPLQMNDTRQFLLKDDSSRFAKGYDESGRPASQWDFKAFSAAGALRSTAYDMLLYARANMGKAPAQLSKAISLTHLPGFTDGQNKTALGWHYIKPGNEEILFHNGGTGGYRSYLAIHLKKEIAIIILSNTAIGTEGIGNELMKWLESN